MEKGIACVVMLIPVAGAELSSTAAVGQHCANLGLRQRTSTAVRAATDPNLLNYRSTAVACTLTYCFGPVDEQVKACGGEYSSSGCWLSETRLRSSGATAAVLESSTPPTGISMTAHIC